MSDNLTRLLDKLQERADLIDSFPLNPMYKYKSMEKLILEVGKPYLTIAKNSKLKGTPKNCYENCFNIIRKRQDLIYCEGYASDDIVTFVFTHAWLINDKGEVVDPTWQDASNVVYFGAAFNRDFVIDFVTKFKEYGILESDYRQEHKFKIEGFPKGAVIN
ncbi:MAG: hypothetical protein KME29_08870 [Calothrix sp. FI2-JRJ7]|jgi:hypothetical protein|nr:hypothetical protein [Calothrix sp. FI2-JRJ7]